MFLRIRVGKKKILTRAAFVTFTTLGAFCAQRIDAAPTAAPSPIAASRIPLATLDGMIQEKRYMDLRTALSAKTRLTPSERDYFQGILDNHANAVELSVRRLERALPVLRRSGPKERLAAALRALADDYGKRFEYGRAADTYRTLDREGSGLTEAQRHEIRDDADQYDLLRGQPPQTIGFGSQNTPGVLDSIAGHHDPLGLLEVPVLVGDTARPAESWVVDTGANISTVTQSTARRLGLKILSGKASVQGIGGADIPMQIAIIPSLHLGRATVRNAAVLVIADNALDVGQPRYQIQGIIGFPVLAALGRLTFGPQDRITFGGPPSPGPSNLYLEELTPLVAAGTDGDTHLFTFDSGANISVLTARYWKEHHKDLTGAVPIAYRFMGADGLKSVPARQAAHVTLGMGGKAVSLTKIPVLTGPIGNPTTDAFYGNLGQDLIKPFTSYTLDFHSMQFTLQR